MNEPLVPISAQPWRTGMAMVAFAGLFGLVGYRLHFLQVDEGERLERLGERQRVRTWTIQAPRGGFYDDEGAPLVVSDGTWTVTADPLYMDDKLDATVELARILGVDRAELRRQFELPRNGRTIAKGLDDEHAEQVKKLKLAGLYVRREFTRRYPAGALAAQVLGFVSADGVGGAGLEHQFDKLLAGVPGKETVTIDALGKPSLTDAESAPARAGADLQLTINSAIQRELEQDLLEQVEKSQPAGAAGLVIRPATGEIVAMASWPSFDPRELRELKPAALRNNAIAFVYEPGSTMKPLVAGATVAEGLTHWSEVIDCERGSWTYRTGKAARTIHESTGGHGLLSVVQGIALSDNILMAKLGIRMGPQRLYRWETSFGFGRRTGICLPGEDAGIMLRESSWSVLGSCMSVPMGHEIAVTPLQLAMAHAAVANGGMWLPPRLVKRIHASDDKGGERELELPALPPSRRVFAAEDAAQIQEAMTHTMTEGTGKKADLVGYTCAGKTGTAEKLVGGHYSHSNHVGSFVCWAPAEPNVRPELLCLVVIDDPAKGGHYGAETAAPVVQKVLQAALETLHVPKRPDLLADADKPKGDAAKGDRAGSGKGVRR
jgi:cell division protein FtsI (penicillin-binding protein 3)